MGPCLLSAPPPPGTCQRLALEPGSCWAVKAGHQGRAGPEPRLVGAIPGHWVAKEIICAEARQDWWQILPLWLCGCERSTLQVGRSESAGVRGSVRRGGRPGTMCLSG